MNVTEEILALLLRNQRQLSGPTGCRDRPCLHCLAVHEKQVLAMVEAGRPLQFVLPAFPGKSPNTAKVLGTLPDMAERLALEFLDKLVREIRAVYAPGAEIIICSDGRVFSDAVGIPDADITAYQRQLQRMIDVLPAGAVRLFTLDHLPRMAGLSYDEMRAEIDERYAEPLESLQERIRAGEEVPLYRAITRFLYEDGNTPGYAGSKSALQRDARRRAYWVIQRSKAWGDLLLDVFPEAVRLSIHPQACGAPKLGIHLAETADDWLTPWHSVAVRIADRFVLMKRAEAEELGAELLHVGGKPSHYLLRPAQIRVA